MTPKKMNQIIEKLIPALNTSFDFNQITVKLIFAKRVKHPKNWVIDTHYHPWFEFNYVSKGSVYTTIEGKEFLIKPGESYIIPPGIPHSHRHNNTGDDGICLRFCLSPKAITTDNILKILSTPSPASFNPLIERILLSESLYSTFGEFFAFLMRIYDCLNVNHPQSDPTGDNSFSQQVIMFLEEYHQSKIQTEDISKALNTSYRTLARKFKFETGITISEKLIEIRINKAKQLLISTDLPMYKVARETGFENEFYFSKRFKQYLGIPPKEYRRKNVLPDLD